MRDVALPDIAPRLSVSSLAERLRYRYSQTAEVLKAERLTIAISGGKPERKLFEKLTAPHRLMPLIARKSLGAALAQVPATPGDVLRGETYKVARKKRRTALSKGFVVRPARPLAHIDDIMTVNTSVEVRQDRPMDPDYVSKEQNIDFFSDISHFWGVFKQSGELIAYVSAIMAPGVLVFYRVIGHSEYLKDGVMYLLIAEIISEMAGARAACRRPEWIMYDMFWRASPGIRQFKRALGFRPYRVKWIWVDDEDS